MQREHIFYLAALIEGEGYFNPIKPCMSLSSTDLETIERAKNYADDIGTVHGPYWAKKSTKPYWEWNVSECKDLARLLLAITPIMSERRREEIDKVATILLSKSKPRYCLSRTCGEFIKTNMRTNSTQYCDATCRTREWRALQRERRGT